MTVVAGHGGSNYLGFSDGDKEQAVFGRLFF